MFGESDNIPMLQQYSILFSVKISMVKVHVHWNDIKCNQYYKIINLSLTLLKTCLNISLI